MHLAYYSLTPPGSLVRRPSRDRYVSIDRFGRHRVDIYRFTIGRMDGNLFFFVFTKTGNFNPSREFDDSSSVAYVRQNYVGDSFVCHRKKSIQFISYEFFSWICRRWIRPQLVFRTRVRHEPKWFSEWRRRSFYYDNKSRTSCSDNPVNTAGSTILNSRENRVR